MTCTDPMNTPTWMTKLENVQRRKQGSYESYICLCTRVRHGCFVVAPRLRHQTRQSIRFTMLHIKTGLLEKMKKKQRLKPYNGGSSLHCAGIVLLLIVCKGCSAISNEMATFSGIVKPGPHWTIACSVNARRMLGCSYFFYLFDSFRLGWTNKLTFSRCSTSRNSHGWLLGDHRAEGANCSRRRGMDEASWAIHDLRKLSLVSLAHRAGAFECTLEVKEQRGTPSGKNMSSWALLCHRLLFCRCVHVENRLD